MGNLEELVKKINNCADDVEYRELMEQYYKLSRNQLGIAEEKTDSVLQKVVNSDYTFHWLALAVTIVFTALITCWL